MRVGVSVLYLGSTGATSNLDETYLTTACDHQSGLDVRSSHCHGAMLKGITALHLLLLIKMSYRLLSVN